LEVGQIIQLTYCQAPTTNLTQHDSHGQGDYLKTIDYHHLDMSRDDGMDDDGIDWLYGCHLVGFGLEVGQITADFCQAPNTNLTQHDLHVGQGDHIKTIDYHHLDMSRDDDMDEDGIDWLYG
jgi:hypothetical protein